jgi:flavin reductase (DIM6/NTAB) family NADH-FMN oxidoreductase RutF
VGQWDTQACAAFDAIMATADYPICIVTTAVGEHRSGCLVGFAGQVSIEPRRFLVGLSTKNHTYAVARRADHLAVHLTGRDNVALAQLFGAESGSAIDKFAHCDWHIGPHGLPILGGAAAWFTGSILARHDLGDHVGFLLDVTIARAPGGSVTGLRYHDVADISPGRPA